MKIQAITMKRTEEELIRKTVKNAVAIAICLAGHRKESSYGFEYELPSLLVLSTGRTGRISTKTFRAFWFNDGVTKKRLCDAELLEVFYLLIDKAMI